MSPSTDLMALGPRLNGRQIRHLRRLVSWWTLLADLSFSDLLLFLPVLGDHSKAGGASQAATGQAAIGQAATNSTATKPKAPARFVIADQVRANTGRTLYRDDYVGVQVSALERPFVAAAFKQGRIQTGEVRLVPTRTQAHVTSIPVLCDGKVIAALSREVSPEHADSLGDGNLERNYLQTFAALADMVATGDFPYPVSDLPLGISRPGLDPLPEELLRVGDGMLLVSDADVVTFASPNAVSALHRVGVTEDVEGKRLDEIGLAEDELSLPRPRSAPVTSEIERYGAAVELTALPLRHISSEFSMQEQPRLGALVLLRDVTALRQRDQLLLSKDRTISEIHHRVKNNLQTISSLLRIQARRLSSDEASQALQEAIRRIGAIALVHEALSTEAADDVDFCGVAHVIADTMRHSLTSMEGSIDFVVRCSVGNVPAEIVTPLAVVLNELLQNAVDHAYPEIWLPEGSPGSPEGSPEGTATDGEEGTAAGRIGTVEISIDSFSNAGGAIGTGDTDGANNVGGTSGAGSPDSTSSPSEPTVEMLRMEVRDDGMGLPADFDIDKTLGLGTSIVRALTTADLGGTITYSRRQPGPGSVVLVEVPIKR